MWRFVRDNPKAVIFAVLVHVAFAAVLILTLDANRSISPINPDAKIIKAKVIDEAKIKKEQKRKKDIERKKREKLQQEKKRKAELKKKRELEKKKKLALKKKAEAKKKKLAEEKKRKEELQKKQERQQRIAELQKQMAEEEAERKKQAKRAAQQKEVDRYRALIKQAISNKWRVPFSARKGQECILKLRLIPSGEVVRVEVVKSSGDTEYDLSVEKAVYSAMPLPLPQAESGLFDEFREINVPFRFEGRK